MYIDNRWFFSRNQAYPDVAWDISLHDPGYVSDSNYYNKGFDLAKIKEFIPGHSFTQAQQRFAMHLLLIHKLERCMMMCDSLVMEG